MITAEVVGPADKTQAVFDDLTQQLKLEQKTYDGQLVAGRLSKSSVAALFRAVYLERLINEVEERDVVWTPERTHFLWRIANWSRGESKGWARFSAQRFLEVCGENGFGVRFY